jgi:hypothetical protein
MRKEIKKSLLNQSQQQQQENYSQSNRNWPNERKNRSEVR